MPAKRPDSAQSLAAKGSSKAPGTRKVWTEASLTPPSSKPSAAPFSSRSAMSS